MLAGTHQRLSKFIRGRSVRLSTPCRRPKTTRPTKARPRQFKCDCRGPIPVLVFTKQETNSGGAHVRTGSGPAPCRLSPWRFFGKKSAAGPKSRSKGKGRKRCLLTHAFVSMQLYSQYILITNNMRIRNLNKTILKSPVIPLRHRLQTGRHRPLLHERRDQYVRKENEVRRLDRHRAPRFPGLLR